MLKVNSPAFKIKFIDLEIKYCNPFFASTVLGIEDTVMKNSQGLMELMFWFRETNSKQDNFSLELRTVWEIK